MFLCWKSTKVNLSHGTIRMNIKCNIKLLFSTGIYPSCKCENPFQYDEEWNSCLQCPENSTGTYPNCKCSNGLFGIRTGQCVECPANSTGLWTTIKIVHLRLTKNYSILGIYPDCECEQLDNLYSAYINQCYIECGSGSTGLYPYCKCDEPGTYYEPEEFACKSNVGRKCPDASIGEGPDCLCIQNDIVFIENFWGCYFQNTSFAYPSAQCPGGNKWPQCSVEIDRNTLLSLVGWLSSLT